MQTITTNTGIDFLDVLLDEANYLISLDGDDIMKVVLELASERKVARQVTCRLLGKEKCEEVV